MLLLFNLLQNMLLEKFKKIRSELGNCVSIVSDYELDGRVSIPDKGRGFFL
jgi:hypothetical protein